MKDIVCNNITSYICNLKKKENICIACKKNNINENKKPTSTQKLILRKKNIEQRINKNNSNMMNAVMEEKFELPNLLDRDIEEMSCLESEFLNAELGESYPNDETGTFIYQKDQEEENSCEIFDFNNSTIIKYINDNVSLICKSDLNEQSLSFLNNNFDENNGVSYHFNNINEVKVFNTKQSIFNCTNIEHCVSQNKHKNCFIG